MANNEYKNKLIDKVIFGGLYRVPYGQWNNEQSNGLCVPIVDENGNLWMQDTYQIQRPHYKDNINTAEAQIQNMVSYGSGSFHHVLHNARWNYYYKNNEMITNENELSKYELIADLRKYRLLERFEDYRDYKSDDVIHGIKLYLEHGYSWTYGDVGVAMVRKDAVKNSERMLKRRTQDLLNSIKRPSPSQCYANYVKESLALIDDNDDNKDIVAMARYALKLNCELDRMKDELEEFCKNAKEELQIEGGVYG